MDKVVYLDYNATTPLADEVIKSITKSLLEDWANPSSKSELGLKARRAIESARDEVARMINAESRSDIVFTSGGTESNNMAILSAVEWGKKLFTRPHVVLSNVEHVATSAPVKHLANKDVISFTEVAVNKDGCLEVDAVLAAIRPETVLVTVMMANNETGVIFPIPSIGRELKVLNQKRKNPIYLHVDAAQAVGKIMVDVQELEVDYLSIVGHKFYGPRVGALYVRTARVPLVCPVVRGGGQEGNLRPGTENTPMIVGLGVAARLVTDHLHRFSSHMQDTRDYLQRELMVKTKGVVNCERSTRLPNTLSVSWRGSQLSGDQLLQHCPHLVASTTAACHSQALPSNVLTNSGVPHELGRTTVRLSVGRSTTKEDIDLVVSDLEKALLKQTHQ